MTIGRDCAPLFPAVARALPLTLHESIALLFIVALAMAWAVTLAPVPHPASDGYQLIRIVPTPTDGGSVAGVQGQARPGETERP